MNKLHSNREVLRAVYKDMTRITEFADADIVLHKADQGAGGGLSIAIGREAVLSHQINLIRRTHQTLYMDVHDIIANDHFGSVLGEMRASCEGRKIIMPFATCGGFAMAELSSAGKTSTTCGRLAISSTARNRSSTSGVTVDHGNARQPVGACTPDCQQVHIMLRIRGTVGQWPVDLTLELDEGDWAQLGAQLKGVAPEAPAAVAEQAAQPGRQALASRSGIAAQGRADEWTGSVGATGRVGGQYRCGQASAGALASLGERESRERRRCAAVQLGRSDVT